MQRKATLYVKIISKFLDEWPNYYGGVYAGCDPADKNTGHAVTVVGYGTTDDGEDYWLIKNSWSKDWGEGGYIRLKKGVGMCNIGNTIAVVSCEKVQYRVKIYV